MFSSCASRIFTPIPLTSPEQYPNSSVCRWMIHPRPCGARGTSTLSPRARGSRICPGMMQRRSFSSDWVALSSTGASGTKTNDDACGGAPVRAFAPGHAPARGLSAARAGAADPDRAAGNTAQARLRSPCRPGRPRRPVIPCSAAGGGMRAQAARDSMPEIACTRLSSVTSSAVNSRMILP